MKVLIMLFNTLMTCNTCKHWKNPSKPFGYSEEYGICTNEKQKGSNGIPKGIDEEISKLNPKKHKDEIKWLRQYTSWCTEYSEYYSTSQGFSCNDWKSK